MGYDVFLAHAGADLPAARALHDLLAPTRKVFLDAVSLLPGALWDEEIPAAQADSRMTVVLISKNSDAGYYDKEEVAAAIALHRSSGGAHRVVPVYLEPPSATVPVPYGLRRLHALDVQKLGGLKAAAQEVERTFAVLGGQLVRPIELAHPTGTVPVDCPLYVERETDAAAAREMDATPGMVHIIGPRQVGKSSLLARLAGRARRDPGGPLVVSLTFQDLEAGDLADLRRLLVQLAATLLAAAGRDSAEAATILTSPLTPKLACKQLIQREVLARHPAGVLLALDEVDRVVGPGPCAQDFFAMLRSWHEAGKQDPVWARLRIALCFSTEAYMTPQGLSESPLSNVGLKCRLRDFRPDEVAHLVPQHGLSPLAAPVDELMESFGGAPYLTRRTLYALAREGYDLARIESEAVKLDGPLGDHLERHLRRVQAQPPLRAGLRAALDGGRVADLATARALEGAGLARRDGPDRLVPRCGLYRRVFAAHL